MGEAMIDLCDPRLAQFGFDRRPAPFAAGQRAHPAEHALFGPPDEPDAPVAFDPLRDAMALRPRLLRGLDRKPFDIGASAPPAVRHPRAERAGGTPRRSSGAAPYTPHTERPHIGKQGARTGELR